jgi:DNA-directed RNA polymerase specialized sigma24 family protein
VSERSSPITLADVLYANKAKALVFENDWSRLIHSIAEGDPIALHALYERTHRLVFTLILRITHSRQTAEELTLQVFHGVWRDARDYDVEGGSVLGWLMNHAHSRATERMDACRQAIPEVRGLAALTPEERLAIEGTYFSELTYAEVATRLNQPVGTLKASLRSGLGKLRQALTNENPASEEGRCDQMEWVSTYVLHALPACEVAPVEAHIYACPHCQEEMKALRPVIDSLVSWPTDILRPAASLRTRLACRIAAETGGRAVVPERQRWVESQWEEVASGISCNLLANDAERDRVSMLVHLAPGVDYPPHIHAGLEELHLLHGELWIDERKLYPGDYNRAEPGTADHRVWSETGCTCVLVTSPRDALQ